jgi:hypothetical protein
MPEHLTWHRDKVETAVGELIELVITDPVIVDRIHELIVERRSRRPLP